MVTQLGQNGAIIAPDISRVLSTRSGEAMMVGEEREIFPGDIEMDSSLIVLCPGDGESTS